MSKRLTTEEFIERAKKVHNNYYIYDNQLKLAKVKSLGYNVKYIWENDWNRFKKESIKIQRFKF